MKKILILIVFVFFTGFAGQQERAFKVEANMETWQLILRVIDLSEAPAKDRVAVRDFIIRQLNDTTINKPFKK